MERGFGGNNKVNNKVEGEGMGGGIDVVNEEGVMGYGREGVLGVGWDGDRERGVMGVLELKEGGVDKGVILMGGN